MATPSWPVVLQIRTGFVVALVAGLVTAHPGPVGAAQVAAGGDSALPAVLSAPNIEALRKLDAGAGQAFARTLGFATPGDGGGGDWVWDPASTANENSCVVIRSARTNGAGRWVLDTSRGLMAKQCGARFDGTDDTAALQSAVDASCAQTSAPLLVLPVGQARQHAALVAPRGCGLKIKGMGVHQTTLVNTCPTCDGIDFFNAGDTLIYGARVEGLSLIAAGPFAQVNSSGTGIVFQSESNQSGIFDTLIRGYDTGIEADHDWNWALERTNVQFFGRYGLALGANPDFKTSGGLRSLYNQFYNGGCQESCASSIGLYQNRSGGDYFIEDEFNAARNCILLKTLSDATAITYDRFDSIICDASLADGVVIDTTSGGATGYIAAVTFINLWSSFAGGDGVVIKGAMIDGISFNGGQIRENSGHGIHFDESATGANNLLMDGMQISANGRLDRGAGQSHYAVYVGPGVSGWHLKNSVIGNFASASKYSQGVYISPGSSANFSVESNIFVGVAGTGVVNNSTAPQNSFSVDRNMSK